MAESAPNNKDTAERKTSNTVSTNESSSGSLFKGTDSDKYAPAAEKNVLNQYRSWTYNFVIGALPTSVVNEKANIKLLSETIDKYLVLTSYGKGNKKIGDNNSVVKSTATNYDEVLGLVRGFNENSAGRFDMYIDDVEIESLIGAGTPITGSSQALALKWKVFEPYSMNGFPEALQVAAQAAGYPTYMVATFALKVQFIGWKDNQNVKDSKPEIIPNSTRFFIFTITELAVDVTEEGTKYQVSAVPTNQLGFGNSNVHTSNIKVEGDTVWKLLQNYFKALNQMAKDDAIKARGDQNAKHDIYEISAPALATEGKPQDVLKAMLYSPRLPYSQSGPNGFQNKIISAKMNEGIKDYNVFQTGDPASAGDNYVGARPGGVSTVTSAVVNNPGAVSSNPTTINTVVQDPSTGKIVPISGTVTFGAGQQIHESIAAIVRDSQYVRDDVLKKQVEEAKKSDLKITWFLVRLEVEKLEFDTIGNKFFHVYRYVLEPYQMLVTRVPGQEQGTLDHTPILKEIKREYNYIYTGKNIDIVKFQLKFDNLYFTALPKMLGNKEDISTTPVAAGPNNVIKATNTSSTVAQTSVNNNPKTISSNSKSVPTNSYQQNNIDQTHPITTAGPPQSDPYFKMAQTMYDAVLNGVDLIQGDMEILGDPYYLVNGGTVTEDLEVTSSPMQKTDGQAAVTQGDLFININFRNPIDIDNAGPNKGFAYFDKNLIPFSGIFRVLTLISSFKSGEFKQTLSIIRCPGQIVGKETPTPPGSLVTAPSTTPGTQLTLDTAPPTVTKIGKTLDSFDISGIINRGLPNVGLPGVPSNFTNSLQKFNTLIESYKPVAIWTDYQATGETGGKVDLTGFVNAQNNALTTSLKGSINQLTGSLSGQTTAQSAFGSRTLFGISSVLNKVGNDINPATANAISNTINDVLSKSSNDASAVLSQVGGSSNSFLSQLPGAFDKTGKITSQLGTDFDSSPLSGIDPLSKGISLSPSALTNNVVGSSAAAIISSVGSKVGSLGNIPNAAVGLADNIADSIASSTLGSSNLSQLVSRLSKKDVSGLVGGASNAINGLQNTITTDLTGIASKLGIDPAKISGLDPRLASKVTEQLTQVTDLIPENVDISAFESKGLVFKNITGYQLPNLPPVQPESVAPTPTLDPALFYVRDSAGNVLNLLSGQTNLPNLTDINKVSNTIGGITAGLNSTLKDGQSVFDQVGSAAGQLNAVVGLAKGASNLVGSLSQNTVGKVMPASIGLGSVESAASAVSSIAQSPPAISSSALSKSAIFALGSRQEQSPLQQLIQSNNLT